MNSFTDVLWNFSAVLSRVGLASALGGVFMVAYGFIDYLRKHPNYSDEPLPRIAWLGKWGTLGFILLIAGVALSGFVIALRIVFPWGE
jgi:hypothetical protein